MHSFFAKIPRQPKEGLHTQAALTNDNVNRYRERKRKAAENVDASNTSDTTVNADKRESKRKPHDYTAKVDALLDSENDLDAPFPVQPPPLSQNQFIKQFIESMDALTDLVACSVCQEQRRRQDMAEYQEIPNKDLLAAPESARACDTVDGYYLERTGIHAPADDSGQTTYTVCNLCHDALAKRKIPARAIANGLAFGSVPDCLKDLTITERILINPIRTKLWLVILKQVVGPGSGQRAIKGHSISLPTNTQAVVNTVLPLDPETLRDELNVVLARDHEPNEDELKRLFTVRVSRVQAALEYLIATRQGTSSAYAECHIDRERLRKLPSDGIPQQIMDTMSRLDPEAFDSTYAGYATDTLQTVEPDRVPPSDASTTPILMDHSARIDHDMSSIGLDDRNGTALQSLLSWRKPNGSATLVLPHGARPVQEYREERFYSDSFAHLFVNCQAVPLADRPTPLSIDDFFMHCFLHVDPRWRKDISFMFVALNNTMRREAMQNVFLKLRPSTLAACNQQFGQITSERLTAIANNMKDPVNYPVSAETSKIGRFLRERVETTQSSVELTNGNKKMLRRWLKEHDGRVRATSLLGHSQPERPQQPVVPEARRHGRSRDFAGCGRHGQHHGIHARPVCREQRHTRCAILPCHLSVVLSNTDQDPGRRESVLWRCRSPRPRHTAHAHAHLDQGIPHRFADR